jgi:hypothetical protein
MRRVLKNFHHQDPSNPLLDILLRSIYPSSIAQNRISSINVISYYAKKRKEAFMDRKASAVWTGGLKDGKGTLSTDSGVLKQAQYSFSTRFENGIGTNP